MQGVGRAGHLFIGPGGVQHTHEHVSVDHGLHGLGDQGSRQGEARVGLHAVGIDGDHRDLGHPCLFQGTADEADVVGGPAAAAGLGHDHCCVVQVVFP